MQTVAEFRNWIFKQKDIDAQVISLLIAAAVSGLIGDVTKGVIDPLVAGVLGSNKDSEQKLGPFKFKFQMVASGFVKMFVIFLIVYRFAQLTKNL